MSRLAVTSQETTTTADPVVETSELGAQLLGSRYWREVETVTRRLVRVHEDGGTLALRLLGRGPALVALGRPALRADSAVVSCRYPIVGGLLVYRAGGLLAFEQIAGERVVLRSTLTDYFPRLPGRLYSRSQARLHAAVSRRYFAQLVQEPR